MRGVALVIDNTLAALLATKLIEAPEILLVRSFTGDPVFNPPPPMRTLAVDVMEVRRVRAVGVEMVEALVLAIWYKLGFSVAEEAVDTGREALPEPDLVGTRAGSCVE